MVGRIIDRRDRSAKEFKGTDDEEVKWAGHVARVVERLLPRWGSGRRRPRRARWSWKESAMKMEWNEIEDIKPKKEGQWGGCKEVDRNVANTPGLTMKKDYRKFLKFLWFCDYNYRMYFRRDTSARVRVLLTSYAHSTEDTLYCCISTEHNEEGCV